MKPDTSRWSDASAYGFVRSAPVAAIAWEFLRRNRRYQVDVEPIGEGGVVPSGVLEGWGLHFRRKA